MRKLPHFMVKKITKLMKGNQIQKTAEIQPSHRDIISSFECRLSNTALGLGY